MENLQVLNFKNNEIRMIMIDNEPWWVAKDVCNVLEITNSCDAISRLRADEKGVCTIHTLGGNLKMAIVNELGLYILVLGSRKPEAKEFRHWLIHEAPFQYASVRMCATGELLVNPKFATKVFNTLHEECQQRLAFESKVEALETKIEQDKPLVDFANAVSGTSDLISMLRDEGYLDDKNLPYKKYINAGYFRIEEVAKDTRHGVEFFPQTMITGKGQIYLAEKFRQDMQKSAQKAEK